MGIFCDGPSKSHLKLMRIRSKTTISLILLVTVPLLICGLFIYSYGKNKLLDIEGMHSLDAAQEALEVAAEYVVNLYEKGLVWASLEVMEDVLTDDVDGRITNFLMKEKGRNPLIVSLEVLNLSGQVVAANSLSLINQQFIKTDSLRAALQGTVYVSDVFLEPKVNLWVMEASFPIWLEYETKEVVGVLRLVWRVDGVSEGIYRHYSEMHGSLLAVSSDNILIFQENGFVIGGTSSVEEKIFKQNILHEGEEAAKLVGQRKEGYLIEQRESLGKGKYLVGYSFAKGNKVFKNLGWGAIVFNETKRVLMPLDRMGKFILFVWGIGVMVSLGMAFVISKRIIKPVLKVVDVAKQVAGGDLEARINYEVKDELGELTIVFNDMIDELKKQREKFLTEKSYADSIMNAVADAIITMNASGFIETFNKAAEKMFGYRQDEIVNQNITTLILTSQENEHEDDEYLRRYVAPGSQKVFAVGQEAKGIKKSGETFPLEMSITQIFTADTRRIFIGILRDVSERKRIESEIMDLARVPDQNPFPVMRIASDGVVLYANKSSFLLLDAWGCDVGQVVRDDWQKQIKEVLEEVKHKEIEVICDETVFSLTFVPIKEFNYVNIYGHDITDRKRASIEVRERGEQISSIVRAAVDGIITINEAGEIQLFNPAASRIFGYDEKEVFGKNIESLMPSTAHRKHYEKYLAHYAKTGDVQGFGTTQEIEGIHKDGREIPLDLSLSEMIMSNGQRLFIGIVRDITERKQAEEEIKKAMAAKDEFTSVVSHELRTPLAISKEALSLILRAKVGEITDAQKDIISIASSNIDRLSFLINDILDATKIGAGKMELHKERINIVNTIQESYEGWKFEADAKEVDLLVEMPSTPIMLEVDKSRFMQILANLINNAIKYTSSNGSVTIKVEEKTDHVKFLITDTGIGIAQEDILRIFDRFQQINRKDRPGKQGTGLGLHITKSLIELHGGQIFVDSKVGEGSTFVFIIPREKGRDGQVDNKSDKQKQA